MIYLTILSEIPQNLNSTLLPHIEEQKHQLAEVYHISHGLKNAMSIFFIYWLSLCQTYLKLLILFTNFTWFIFGH